MKSVQLVEIKGVWLPQEVEVPDEEVRDTRTYEEKVESKIREKYSLNDELAILRQRDIKKQEFNEYFEYVEKCKLDAKNK